LPVIQSLSNLRLSTLPFSLPGRHHVSTRTESNVFVDDEPVVPFYVSAPLTTLHKCKPSGWLRLQVAKALKEDHETEITRNQRSPWQLLYTKESDSLPESVAFAPWTNTEQERTLRMKKLLEGWRQRQLFEDILSGQ
jgi:hypothetical protein